MLAQDGGYCVEFSASAHSTTASTLVAALHHYRDCRLTIIQPWNASSPARTSPPARRCLSHRLAGEGGSFGVTRGEGKRRSGRRLRSGGGVVVLDWIEMTTLMVPRSGPKAWSAPRTFVRARRVPGTSTFPSRSSDAAHAITPVRRERQSSAAPEQQCGFNRESLVRRQQPANVLISRHHMPVLYGRLRRRRRGARKHHISSGSRNLYLSSCGTAETTCGHVDCRYAQRNY
jgi:hypothetical protein